jgi:DNA-binding IclR family transcriptional regulator
MLNGMTISEADPAGPPASGSGDFQPVKSADRTLDVLEALSRDGELSLSELALKLKIPKSSLHGILRTLEARGWTDSDPTRSLYRLGMSSLLIGMAYVNQDLVVARTSDGMDMLAHETGETIHLARLEGSSVVYLAKRESIHPLRMYSSIGRRLPAYSTALGKALLSHLPDDTVRTLLPDTLATATPHSIADHDALIAELAQIRARGYSIDNEESELGLRCFGVALPFDAPGAPKNAISCSVPVARLNPEREARIVELLTQVQREIAAEHIPQRRTS